MRSAEPDIAIGAMLKEFAGNRWLTEIYWPENEERVRLMIADIGARYPPSRQIRILDVGCFNGYLSVVLHGLGYGLTATDVCEIAERQLMFERVGIDFFYSNLNDLDPFSDVNAAPFDVVIMGEVIEHVLNHPLGLVRAAARLLRSQGLLVMTTPNPSTLMNAARLIADQWTLWGTQEFIESPKISGDEIISKADIHYREYRTSEVCHLLVAGGFEIDRIRYMGIGVSRGQQRIKRIAKSNPLSRILMSTRLFGCTHYFLATKTA